MCNIMQFTDHIVGTLCILSIKNLPSFKKLCVLYLEVLKQTIAEMKVTNSLKSAKPPHQVNNLFQLYLFFDFVSLPPQIAALQKGGDSFPLTAASGKVLGKVRQRTDTRK